MPTSSKTKSRQVARYYWRHVKKYPVSFFGALIMIPVTILCGQILPPLIVANVIRRLSTHDFVAHQPWQSFGHSILLYAGLILFTGFVSWRIVDIFVFGLEAKVEKDIAKEVFNHIANESADFHANHFSGSMVSQTNKLLSAYVRIADTTAYTTIGLISFIVLVAVIMLPRAPLFVAFIILFASIYLTVAFLLSKSIRESGAMHADAESQQSGYLADVVGNVMAVKSFAGEDFEETEFEKRTEFTRSKLKALTRAHMKQMFYFGAVSRTTQTMALALAIVSIVSFKADLATVFLILSYASSITEQLFSFSNSALRNYNRSIGDASAMVQILNSPAEIKDPVEPETSRMNEGAISFNDVTFRHKGAASAIFDGLNISISPGEKVGLVGHSGSGKTSLTRILLRFSDINGGAILIDGQNIANVKQSDLRRNISYVPQEPILFHRTISENIAYGQPDANPEEIIAISKKAHAHEFIKTLQHGYDTVVGERGVKLSGGQRQRIAIARAMIKNAPILVLDEATSALDSESEALIQDALWKLMEGRTAIVIAHRLSTIQKMDRIIVLGDGQIVEEGSHKDLLNKKGVYAKLWERQSGGFLED
ncbi:MAG: MdlB, multidrug/protein/lipid transporter ATPase, ATP-binding cassette, subfamily bacterial [Candidatus Saccharibacteria bacterium]|nr:MdlB, multidrug/protein/lipid transporter ATPase, ATP-binding cassette, subfamily bacterial [Candidatus Saccharibacteria bacterium]